MSFALLSLVGCQPGAATSQPASAESSEPSTRVIAVEQLNAPELAPAPSNAGPTKSVPSTPLQPDTVAGDEIRVLAWNIESDGADIDVIADQLLEMGHYDLYGFTEVHPRQWPTIRRKLGDRFDCWYSRTGYNDRTAYAVSKDRFEIINKEEFGKFGDVILNPGNYRSPHVYQLRDRKTNVQFVVVLNHLARGKAEVRQRQAEGLRRWAASLDTPVIALGDYNFDYVFKTETGNAAFDIFMSDDTFVWVKPQPLIDSNWFDGDGDQQDDYPGSILDFVFVAGDAKNWNPKSRVIVRDGDFPDDDLTSDHRPIELTITPQ